MTAASKWVDEAMSAASVATDAAWDAGKCEEYGAKLAAPDVELRDRKLEELRAHLTTQAALCEQLAEALQAFASIKVNFEASTEIVPNGYSNPEDWRNAVYRARSVLLAYEGSKQ